MEELFLDLVNDRHVVSHEFFTGMKESDEWELDHSLFLSLRDSARNLSAVLWAEGWTRRQTSPVRNWSGTTPAFLPISGEPLPVDRASVSRLRPVEYVVVVHA